MQDNELQQSPEAPEQVATSPDVQQTGVPSLVPPPPVLPPSAMIAAQSGEQLSMRTQRQWNWGAFFLTLFWLPSMKLWKLFWYYIGFIVLFILLESFIPSLKLLFRPINLVILLWVAKNGNVWAWQSSRVWESELQFVQIQRAWSRWGVGIFITAVLIAFFAAIIASSLLELPDQ